MPGVRATSEFRLLITNSESFSTSSRSVGLIASVGPFDGPPFAKAGTARSRLKSRVRNECQRMSKDGNEAKIVSW